LTAAQQYKYMIPTKSAAAYYLEHLNEIFQQEPELYQINSFVEGLPGVSAIVYRDIPEKGYITAFTYGLSLGNHPDWKYGKPELCISVKSSKIEWGQVAAYVASKLRGDCPFLYGETINFGTTISDDSEMNAFFVFAPGILEREDYTNIEVGEDYKINIAGLYPIYAAEIEVFEKLGLEQFWHHADYDNFSVTRKRITA